MTLAVTIVAAAWTLPALVAQVNAPPSPNGLIGLTLDVEKPWPTIRTPMGPEAMAAGLAHGDRIIAIDGRRPAPYGPAFASQLAGPIGGTVAVTVQTPAGARHRVRLTRDPDHRRRAFIEAGLTPSLWAALNGGLNVIGEVVVPLACAVLLMVRRRRDRLAPYASLTMLLCTLGNGAIGSAITLDLPHGPAIEAVLSVLGSGSLILVLSVFPDGLFQSRWSLAIGVLGPIIIAASEPFPLSQSASNAVLVVMLLGAVATIGARYQAMPAGAGRQQIRWALLGFAASLGALALLIIAQRVVESVSVFGLFMWAQLSATVLAASLISLLFVCLTVALLRYRLYDADAAISRSLVYGALTLSLLAIFAGSEKVIEIMGERYLGEGLGALAGGLGAAIAAVMVAPIHHRVSHWAERRFRSGLAHLRHGLPLLVGDLRETASPQALADAMLARVEKGVRARHSAVVVSGELLDARDVAPETVRAWLAGTTLPADRPEHLSRDRRDPLFPLRVPLHAEGTGLVGWLLLGPRPDGTFFGRDDRAALGDIADPVARGLAVALARERSDAARAAREQRLQDQIDDLRRALQVRPANDPALD